MQVSVAYAEANRQVWLEVEVTDQEPVVRHAIDKSGILKLFPNIDLESQRVGVFGRAVKLEAPLREGDRVEIYRPIVCDPQSVPRRPGFELDSEE